MKQVVALPFNGAKNYINGNTLLKPLSQLNPGESGKLHSITREDIPEFSLLPALGLRAGKNISVLACSVAGGPVLIEVDTRTIAVDRQLAKNIQLCLGK